MLALTIGLLAVAGVVIALVQSYEKSLERAERATARRAYLDWMKEER